MPTSIRCKICKETISSLLLDEIASATEAGKLLDQHIQTKHMNEYVSVVNGLVVPITKIFTGIVIQNFFSELTDDTYNNTLKIQLANSEQLLINAVKGILQKPELKVEEKTTIIQ